ncbi:hypothetical protein BBFL7_00764 [Flavobacteria bacterium BBFL7]|nr:hypothetical protein BBFL7_00764 [Flavobacteria bacterium BBFL7]
MIPDIKTTPLFYHHLGKLFYAVAFSDKKIAPEEFLKLQEYIEKFWVQYDSLTDIFESDAAHLIEVVFEGAQFFKESPDDMFQSFISYKRKHENLFNSQVRLLILETARAIAHSYAQINKSELIMLSTLEIEFNK